MHNARGSRAVGEVFEVSGRRAPAGAVGVRIVGHPRGIALIAASGASPSTRCSRRRTVAACGTSRRPVSGSAAKPRTPSTCCGASVSHSLTAMSERAAASQRHRLRLRDQLGSPVARVWTGWAMTFGQARSRSVLMVLDNHMITSAVPALLSGAPYRTTDMTARHS
jgi:hypothetical protein